jgi:outer membrane protein insertion porin family
MILRKKALVLALAAAPLFAHGFIVQSIQFSGLSRIPEATVAADQPLKVGDDLTPALSNQVISDLYKTGYFKNIQLINNNGNLVIQVEELPTIAKIDIKGNELIKTADLTTVLNNVGLQVGNMFNQTLINQIQQSLIQEYNSQGKFSVQVKVELTPVSNNRVDVAINIAEGLDTEIQSILFIGNHHFSSRKLLKQLDISTPGLIAFFTKSDVYSQQKLGQSLQDLANFYENHGYVDFHVTAAEASLDSTHTKAFVTISVAEGPKYDFSGFEFKGNLILPETTLEKLVNISAGDTYSKAQITASQQAIVTALGNEGYAFVNVNPVPTIDREKKTVFITFYVTPGQKVYINQVEFTGNTVTNDKTLRQRMKFVEGSTYSKTNIDNSTVALQRLPYMKQVNESIKPVTGTSDQVNVNYALQEQSANTVSAAIGYSGLYGAILQGGFNVNNVFGTGNIFGINAQISKPYQSVNMSYTEPFFTDSGISQTTSLYYTHVNAGDEGLTDFSTNSYGATLGYSIPISTWNFFNFGGGFDHTTLQQPGDGWQSMTVNNFTEENGSAYNTYSINLGLSRDSTNSAYFPTQGETGSIGANIAVPGSTLTYYTLVGSLQWYHALNQYFTLALSGGVSYGNGYGNQDQLPFFRNFYGGGWGSVRGFSAGSMGPQDTLECVNGSDCTPGSTEEGQALGGNLLVDSTAEVLYPVPFMTDNPNLKLITFVDGGNVYDTYNVDSVWNAGENPNYPNFSNIRYTVGVGLEWVSPLGAVGIDIAQPLNSQPGDDTKFFDFTLGTFW